MKKNIWIILIIVVLVIIGIILFMYRSNKELSFDSVKAEDIGVGNIVERLSVCQDFSKSAIEERSKYQNCAYDISDENLTMLKSIQDIKGNKLCSFNEANKNSNCSIQDYIKSDANIVWRFDWAEVVVKQNSYSLLIIRSGSNYFLMNQRNFGAGTPYAGDIYLLESFPPSLKN